MSALDQEQFVEFRDNAEFSVLGMEDCDPLDLFNGDDDPLTIFTHVESNEIIYERQRKRAKLIGKSETIRFQN